MSRNSGGGRRLSNSASRASRSLRYRALTSATRSDELRCAMSSHVPETLVTTDSHTSNSSARAAAAGRRGPWCAQDSRRWNGASCRVVAEESREHTDVEQNTRRTMTCTLGVHPPTVGRAHKRSADAPTRAGRAIRPSSTLPAIGVAAVTSSNPAPGAWCDGSAVAKGRACVGGPDARRSALRGRRLLVSRRTLRRRHEAHARSSEPRQCRLDRPLAPRR